MDSGRHAKVESSSASRRLVGFLLSLAVVVGSAFVLNEFVFQLIKVPSGSMEDAIMPGDMLFSEKVSYNFREPVPRDIVSFQDPEIPGRVLIKRCIAVGGQTVDLVDGRVVVDGVVLDEPYTNGLPSEPLKTAPGVDITYPYTVPKGQMWVMGDNRTNSNDSRYFGSISQDSVFSRAIFRCWPLGAFGPLS